MPFRPASFGDDGMPMFYFAFLWVLFLFCLPVASHQAWSLSATEAGRTNSWAFEPVRKRLMLEPNGGSA